MRLLFPTIGIILAAALAPASALADSGDLTLGLSGGVTVPVASPQLDRFDAGGSAAVRPSVDLTSFLDLGIVGSVTALPSNVKGVDTGTALGLGGGLRLKRPRDAKNTSHGLAAVSPWVDADAQYVRTGALDRGAVSLSAGLAFPTGDSRVLWTGPFVQYTDIVQLDKAGFDSTDAHLVTVGWGLEFGSGAKKKVVKKRGADCSDRDHDGVVDSADRCPDVPGPASNNGCPLPPPKVVPALPHAATVPPVIRQRVQFNLDSSVITRDAEATLVQVLEVLKEHPEWHVEIRGHASSDGPLKHNQVLAQHRANSVMAWLKKHGVSTDHMVAKGLGVSAPVAPNSTEAGRVANRRAEFDVDFVFQSGGSK